MIRAMLAALWLVIIGGIGSADEVDATRIQHFQLERPIDVTRALIVGDDRAARRIGSRESGVALGPAARDAVRQRLPVPEIPRTVVGLCRDG